MYPGYGGKDKLSDYGDFPPSFVCAKLLHKTMATAIVRIYTEDGFLIAADGLMQDTSSFEEARRDVQKIFKIQHSLAFSLTGLILLASHRDEPHFVFTDSVAEAFNALSLESVRTLQEFCNACAMRVQAQLEYFFDKRKVLPGKDCPEERGTTIVEIMVDGYYRGFPSRAKIRFYHEGNRLQTPEVTSVELYPEVPIMKGVRGLGDLLLKQDPSLSRYLHPLPPVRDSQRLTVAAQFARAYIEACSGPEGRAMDETASRGIGGHIHMATITPSGFDWVPGFEPLPPKP